MMFSPVERLIARRYLRPTKGEGFISLVAGFAFLGIALGVGTLIVVMAVMNGFRFELLSRVLGVNGHATVISQGPIIDYQPLVDRLAEAPGVELVFPYVEGQVMASANGAASGALVRGLRIEDLKQRPFIADNVLAGSLDRLEGENVAAIGVRMAQRMGLRVGSPLQLISPKGTATGIGMIPKVVTFTVGAVFEIGMYEYDNSFVYLSLADAQRYFQTGEGVTAIEVEVQHPDLVGDLRPGLDQLLPPGTQLLTWQQVNSHFFNALLVERNVMFLILTLIVLVAAFNIITGLTMLVRSKTRDIAVLRSMGATKSNILSIFLLAGTAIGLVGTGLGAVLGISFAANIDAIRLFLERITGTELFAAEIRFLSQMPARIETGDVVSVVLMGLVLSLLATLYPSFRAAATDPVEALRHE
ncbi:lipoprotein-releasing ABC transporter permease subunit [Geminicoccus flavidas]|uniref:lipoprotein-releasing ABC transporter permease subunit n=1 Tax=Geminicoccus flavidas TaxID=2506407 RepID=UPI00135AAD04|nr:lipoprotein-releasing ABC transporter permease subunit [Geminicoccus flavidas]